jgi:HK97 family phage prohead protease
MKKFLTAYIGKDALGEDGIIPLAVASDGSIDRDGDIIDPAGLDTANYERNPVVLYAHDYRSDPIGKTLSIKKDGQRVLFSPQLAVDISPRAKMYFEMVKAGILNAFSIGFIPKAWTDRQNPDGSITRIFTQTELLEISLVPVPANANALVLAREYVDKLDADKKEIGTALLKDMENPPEPPAEVKTMEERMTEVEAGVKTATDAATKAAEAATEAARVAGEAAESIKQFAQKRDSDNGVVVEDEKASAVKEIIGTPEFQRAVLATVDKVIGTGLRDLKRQ